MTHAPIDVTLQAAITVTASAKTREISGTILPYGQQGHGSVGPIIYSSGSLTVPADKRRVKLLIEHDRAQPVGYLTRLSDDGNKVTATFTVAPTPEGDKALADCENGLRDGFSVGTRLTDYTYDDAGTLTALAADLYETSLCVFPALDDARVKTHHHLKGTPVTSDLTSDTTEKAAPTLEVENSQPQPPSLDADASGIIPARNPAPIHVAASAKTVTLDVAMAEAASAITSGSDLGAALERIAPTKVADKGEVYNKPQWLGELWEATRTGRPLINAISGPRTLTGLSAVGVIKEWSDLVHNWKPGTPLPSKGSFKSKTKTTDVVAWAGANAVERHYIDLLGSSFLRSWFAEAMRESLEKSEAFAVNTIMDKASTLAPVSTFTDALTTMGLYATGLGMNIDFLMVGAGIWTQFTGLKADDVPWWLASQGTINLGTTTGSAGGMTFAVEPSLPDNTILFGDKRAATYFEGPRVDLQANNLAGGKIEVATHLYGAVMVNDPTALATITVA